MSRRDLSNWLAHISNRIVYICTLSQELFHLLRLNYSRQLILRVSTSIFINWAFSRPLFLLEILNLTILICHYFLRSSDIFKTLAPNWELWFFSLFDWIRLWIFIHHDLSWPFDAILSWIPNITLIFWGQTSWTCEWVTRFDVLHWSFGLSWVSFYAIEIVVYNWWIPKRLIPRSLLLTRFEI